MSKETHLIITGLPVLSYDPDYVAKTTEYLVQPDPGNPLDQASAVRVDSISGVIEAMSDQVSSVLSKPPYYELIDPDEEAILDPVRMVIMNQRIPNPYEPRLPFSLKQPRPAEIQTIEKSYEDAGQ